MTHVRNGFEGNTITVPVDRILPTRTLGKDIRHSPKYRTILASIREVGGVSLEKWRAF